MAGSFHFFVIPHGELLMFVRELICQGCHRWPMTQVDAEHYECHSCSRRYVLNMDKAIKIVDQRK